MRPIGGYFELELQCKERLLHDCGILVNSGRNALELILCSLRPRKVLVPYFTCEVVLEPFRKHGIPYEFYHVDVSLEISSPLELGEGEYLLLNNYFGIKDEYVRQMVAWYGDRVIVDNAQALFFEETAHCFYSPRKFVGVPDGGIAVSDGLSYEGLELDQSFDRCSHLLKRYDLGSSAGYGDFRENAAKLSMSQVRKMSCLTEALLRSIDFDEVKSRRLDNFRQLHDALGPTNLLRMPEKFSVPMVYPYLCRDESLRSRLISEQVFVATYWPNVTEWCSPGDSEYDLAKYLIPLPCDQRYDAADMARIIEIINK